MWWLVPVFLVAAPGQLRAALHGSRAREHLVSRQIAALLLAKEEETLLKKLLSELFGGWEKKAFLPGNSSRC